MRLNSDHLVPELFQIIFAKFTNTVELEAQRFSFHSIEMINYPAFYSSMPSCDGRVS